MKPIPEAVANAITELQNQTDGSFFLYDLDSFEAHVKKLAASDLTLWYAVKANPLSSIIQVLAKNGFGFDVASQGELDQVLAQGVSAHRVLNTGPAKSKAQLRYFLAKGVRTYVVESITQLELLETLAAEVDFTPEVLLRVQLDWSQEQASGGSNPLGGCQVTPFGLSAKDWLDISPRHFDNLNIKGLHVFQWGNILSADKLQSLWSAMSEPLNSLAQKLQLDYHVLDLGGGLGIPYSEGQSALVWQDVEAALQSVKQQVNASELWMELGRYAIGAFGYYVNPVIEHKTNHGQHQLIMKGGVNHLMRPAITEQPFPATLLRESEATPQPWSVYGPLCTGLDKLGAFNLPADIGDEDVLVFSQCGAYGFTESMPFFLCHDLPAEAVLYQGNLTIVRQPQPAASWLV